MAEPVNIAPRKFTFDTVFGGEGDVLVNAPKRKPFYSVQEVDEIRAEGFADGQRNALDQAQREQARQLDEIGKSLSVAMGALAKAAHDHRVGAAELAMAAARKIADAALEMFPEAAAQAALQALLSEVEGHPRLLVRASQATVPALQAALDKTAEAAGYPGQITVKSDAALEGAAFIFEWGEGRAAFDPDRTMARVSAALEAALAAEGLHGEPLLTTQEPSDG